MNSTRPSRNGSRSLTLTWQRHGTSSKTCIWPPSSPRRSPTPKWTPTACRHCGAFRRAATRTASCCTATLAAQSSPRCTPTERALGHIAKAVGARALVPNYRRSPEHKFPAQLDDVEKAYRWLLAQRIRPENIASIGHSIGGNLAVSLAVTLRDKGVPLPGAILSVSPWYDLEMKNETLGSNAETDALLSRSLVETFRELWIGGTGVARNDPRVNLLYADLTGLPPIMVYYGAYEMLAGEAVEFAKRAKDAGVDVSLRCLPEGQHNFILGAGRVPEVVHAVDIPDVGAPAVDEVVIALEASPINQYDLLMIAGGYGYRPQLPAIMGT